MTDVTRAIDSGGVVQARTTATIAARILAPVHEVRVSPGDRVRKGETLIVLDGDDLAAAARGARSAVVAADQGSKAAAAELLAAEAGLDLTRARPRSRRRPAGQATATAQELDDAVRLRAPKRTSPVDRAGLPAAAATESARAAGDQASTINSFTRIAAPFDGVITGKMVEPGSMASPGMPLLRLEDTADSASKSA